jgi:hypothetical protein
VFFCEFRETKFPEIFEAVVSKDQIWHDKFFYRFAQVAFLCSIFLMFIGAIWGNFAQYRPAKLFQQVRDLSFFLRIFRGQSSRDFSGCGRLLHRKIKFGITNFLYFVKLFLTKMAFRLVHLQNVAELHPAKLFHRKVIRGNLYWRCFRLFGPYSNIPTSDLLPLRK